MCKIWRFKFSNPWYPYIFIYGVLYVLSICKDYKTSSYKIDGKRSYLSYVSVVTIVKVYNLNILKIKERWDIK